MRELFSQLWNLFQQVIYRNKFHISGTYIIVIGWSSSKIVSGSRAPPPRWLPQCSCIVIESSFDSGERLQAPGSLCQWNLYNIIFLWNMFYQNLYHRKLFLGELFSQVLILAHNCTNRFHWCMKIMKIVFISKF
jgi:hypothetical protein